MTKADSFSCVLFDRLSGVTVTLCSVAGTSPTLKFIPVLSLNIYTTSIKLSFQSHFLLAYYHKGGNGFVLGIRFFNSCVYFLQDGITGRFQLKGINSSNSGKKKKKNYYCENFGYTCTLYMHRATAIYHGLIILER